jgi:LCP family protein required for cell wall assembly
MRRQNIVLWIVIIIGLGGTSLALTVFYRWNKPLGPTLDLPMLTPMIFGIGPLPPIPNLEVSISDPAVSSTPFLGDSATSTPVSTPMPTSQPLCGGPQTMTILVIGSDERSTGYQYGLADSIHVARIDFNKPDIMVIDFPRDLWVEIPDISDHFGITHGKLNQAYFFGNPGMGYYDGPGEGPGLMARTLDLNFGLRVDHYLAIDTQTFVKMVDAVGGIDVEVDEPIDLRYGVYNPGPQYYLAVGTHHLDGEMAYALATNRIPTTFQRMKYEKIVLSALREKLLNPEYLPKIPKLVTQFITSVQTDFSPSEINSLICIAQAVPKENIQVDSFPQDMFTAGSVYDPYRRVNTFIYQVDIDRLRAMVAEYMAGIWPMP